MVDQAQFLAFVFRVVDAAHGGEEIHLQFPVVVQVRQQRDDLVAGSGDRQQPVRLMGIKNSVAEFCLDVCENSFVG
jgi:hypothetical protein